MTTRTTNLRRAIRAVAAPAPTDRELLRRFGEHGDEAAFAALMARHAGMVLGVCRRLLPTVQDAEDACQATFLVLARRASGGRWQDSVANWLFTTARRVADRARLAARRRLAREGKAAVPEAVLPIDRMSGRELLVALDEELAKLLGIYREVLVLGYLEGLSREEIAARIGVPAGTVKIRLERGRKRLGDALTKRGFTVGAGLLALAATTPVRASVRMVLGSPSPAVAALAGMAAARGTVNKSVGVLVALACSAALGIGMAPTRNDAAAPGSESRAPRSELPVTFSGRVLGPDGTPFAGAKLTVFGWGDGLAELGVSGPDGCFQVTVPATRLTRYAHLVARAEGFGMQLVCLTRMNPASGVMELRVTEAELRLVKDHPIRGRVIDTQGRPVAGATVVPTELSVFAKNSLDNCVPVWKFQALGSGYPYQTDDLLWEAGILPTTTTDSEGRFTVTGAGEERLVTLRVRKAGIAETEVWAGNRDGFDANAPREFTREETATLFQVRIMPINPGRLYDANPTVIAEPEKSIRGTVTEADTGRPRAGVKVTLWPPMGRDRDLSRPLTATTDAAGRYEFRGARKMESYQISAIGGTAGYQVTWVGAADTPGYEPVVADIRMRKDAGPGR